MTRFFLVIGGGLVEFGIVGLIWYVARYLDQNYEVGRRAVYIYALIFVVVAIVAFAHLVLWLDNPLFLSLKLPRLVCRDNDREEWRWTSSYNKDMPAYGVTEPSQNSQSPQDGSELLQFFASWRDRITGGLISFDIFSGFASVLLVVLMLLHGLTSDPEAMAEKKNRVFTDNQKHILLVGAVWSLAVLFPMLDVIKRNIWGLDQWREYNAPTVTEHPWDTFCSPRTKLSSEIVMRLSSILTRAAAIVALVFIALGHEMTFGVVCVLWIFGCIASGVSVIMHIGCLVHIGWRKWWYGGWKEEWQFVPDNELPDAPPRPPNPNPPQVPPARSSSWGSGFSADQGSDSWFSSSGPSGPPPPQPPRQ